MPSPIVEILSSATVAAILLAALGWVLRAWITERLKGAVKHEYDREIEAYKSMLGLVHTATAAGQKAAIEARMAAFDRVWKAMLALKNNTGAIILFFDILTVEEYKTLKNLKDFIAIVGTLSDQKIQQLAPDRNIEETRPYIGELIWAYFFAYQAFTIRLVLLAWWSTSKDEDKINWHKDKVTRGLLSRVLTPDEVAHLDALTIGKIEYARRTLEMKVLTMGHRLISGATFGDEAMQQAQAIIEAANNVRKSG